MRQKKQTEISGSAEVDVIATLGDKVKVKTMTYNEFLNLPRSKWRVQAFQKGYHGYKSNC